MKTLIRILALVLVPVFSACVTEPHSCSLDPSSPDPAIAQCALEEEATCVVHTHPECRGGACVQMRGRDGFCTVTCASDSACGETERCVELVLGSGESHCVPASYLE